MSMPEFTASTPSGVVFVEKKLAGVGIIFGFRDNQEPPQYAVVFARIYPDGSATAGASGTFSEWLYRSHTNPDIEESQIQTTVAREAEIATGVSPAFTADVEGKVSRNYPGGVDRLAVNLAAVVLATDFGHY